MKDLLKELGKLSFDFAKVVFAIGIITPLFKDGSYNIWSLISTSALVALGAILIYKGGK
ncbi:hypothetical protein LW135_06625 [Helicobacter sp. faydin-H20]|uniref:hypothetical protein n=1 Tax=Helicobacter anatolicus TaxID=2905874 RepID=UPI001E528182|nr:hypothetical protein [Helicobacter anatolicus]MCE3037494.1 hypothetical protein [Helicobacter anatolicus]